MSGEEANSKKRKRCLEDLEETAYRVAKCVAPCRLQSMPQRYDGVKTDEKILYSRRGERSVADSYVDREEDNDKFIASGMRFVMKKAANFIKKTNPTLAGHLAPDVSEDHLTRPPTFSLCPLNQCTYDMGDLTVNLTPDRTIYVSQYRKISIMGDHFYSELSLLLNKPCSNGPEGCYYATSFFPDVGVVCPIALPSMMCQLLIHHLNVATSTQTIAALLELLMSLLLEDAQIREKSNEKAKCICCLLVSAATMEWVHNGPTTVEGDKSIFLVNTDSATNLGIRILNAPDYFSSIVNISGRRINQFMDTLDITSQYEIKRLPTKVWCVSRKKCPDENTPQ
jgi:hypothetical protein